MVTVSFASVGELKTCRSHSAGRPLVLDRLTGLFLCGPAAGWTGLVVRWTLKLTVVRLPAEGRVPVTVGTTFVPVPVVPGTMVVATGTVVPGTMVPVTVGVPLYCPEDEHLAAGTTTKRAAAVNITRFFCILIMTRTTRTPEIVPENAPPSTI